MTTPVGFVKRIASNGTWADVDWHTHTKRMPTSSLVVQHTIQLGPDTWVTDMDRQQELEVNQTQQPEKVTMDPVPCEKCGEMFIPHEEGLYDEDRDFACIITAICWECFSEM
jgi:hypothetical protein